MKILLHAFALLVLPVGAQEPAPDAVDSIHQQLRDTRTGIISAIESRDVESMLVFTHPEIAVTWQNGETSHGIEELRAFYDRMGRDAFVKFKVPHEPDQLSVLHGGDTAISTGHVVAEYHLLGKSYEFDSRWTATLVRQDDKWLVSAYHVSLNALDNPILNTAKSALWLALGAGLVAGMILTWFIGKLRRKSSS
jgi:ketosteroid isomerase-like protein